MGPHDLAAVMMIRRNWTALTAILISYIAELLDERDTTFGEDREELEVAIRDHVQRMLPALYYAADKSECPEIEESYKSILKEAGLVVPENIEDAIKDLVILFPKDQDSA